MFDGIKGGWRELRLLSKLWSWSALKYVNIQFGGWLEPPILKKTQSSNLDFDLGFVKYLSYKIFMISLTRGASFAK